MKPLHMLLGFGAFAAGAYIYDVLYVPTKAAKQAAKDSALSGKPILNIGAGTPRSSLRTALFGPTLWGDVNMDIAADRTATCGRGFVCFGDANQLPFPDRHFSAVIASHVLEHTDDPVAVLDELARVGDKVYAVVPKWWAPHTWLYTDHKWFVGQDGRIMRLWKR